MQKESKFKELQQRSFLINLAITVTLTLLFVYLAVSVSNESEINSFDPFTILEIDSNADNKAIKKAYRKLSLLYHPDKNPGDRAAEAKFMMVSKAYEALTDETARENWEKFGNPDGKQSLEVSIGLPSFLLEADNRNLVLVAYLVIMVVVVPFCVYTYYSDSSKYGEKDVMYATYSWLHNSLSDTSLLKNYPEVLAGSAEFRERMKPKGPEEKQEIGNLMTKLRSSMPKPKFSHPVCIKGNTLLHAYLLRKTESLSEHLAEDLKYMLRYSTALVDAMISVCKNQDAMKAACSCIEFGQYITQAMWINDSPLLQLPNFGEKEVAACKKGKKPIKTIEDYKALSEDEQKGLGELSEDQKKDLRNFLTKIYPDITVETRVFVDDDEDDKVYEGDLCTVEVTIIRNNLEDGERVGPVHAPFFPFPKKEAYWVLLGQMKQGKIISIEKVTSQAKKITHRIRFLAPPTGRYEFDLLVKSNSYVGCDKELNVEVETMDNSTLPEYKVHPDDAELDDVPTLFEDMLNANIEQDSDDSDDEEEEDEPPKTGAASKKEQLRKARQHDGDDDSDDEAEEVYADK